MKIYFDPYVAIDTSYVAAFVFENISYCIERNKSLKQTYKDGRYWTFNTASAMSEFLVCVSERQVRIAIELLKQKGYLIDGCYNGNPFNRKKWFSYGEVGERVVKRWNENASKTTLPSDAGVSSMLHTRNISSDADVECTSDADVECMTNKTVIETNKNNNVRENDENEVSDGEEESVCGEESVSSKKEAKKAVPACGGSAANARFVVPTRDEVQAYAKSINYELDAQRFLDYYEMTGWMTGKTKIKSWQACVRTWKHRDAEKNKKEPENWL